MKLDELKVIALEEAMLMKKNLLESLFGGYGGDSGCFYDCLSYLSSQYGRRNRMKTMFFLTLLFIMNTGSQMVHASNDCAGTEDVLYVIDNKYATSSIAGVDMSKFTQAQVLADPDSKFTLKCSQIESDSIVVNHLPFKLNGYTFKKVCFLQTKRSVNLTVLADIGKKNKQQNAESPCIYIIDGTVIKGNPNYVMVDRDFIRETEFIPSSEICSLDNAPVSVIKISIKKQTTNVMRIR